MNPHYTHIAIVLDRSGSMGVVRDDTIGGYNRFITDQARVPGRATLTLVQFDSQAIDTIYDFCPLTGNPPLLNHGNYIPRASTPLYDALGKTILDTGHRLKHMADYDRPGKVVFVIITDGFENASYHYDRARVFDMIKHQTEIYKWQFVYIGANQDAMQVGASIGVCAANCMDYAKNTVGIQSLYAAATDNLRCYRTGDKADMSWEAKQRADQEDAKNNP